MSLEKSNKGLPKKKKKTERQTVRKNITERVNWKNELWPGSHRLKEVLQFQIENGVGLRKKFFAQKVSGPKEEKTVYRDKGAFGAMPALLTLGAASIHAVRVLR